MSKILIIGGGGFIGSWLTKELISKKHKVAVLDPFVCYSEVDKKTFKKVLKFRNKNY
mgnify:CR=1 FL=1